jgi:hypothetical protein
MATEPSFETHRYAMLLRMRDFSAKSSNPLVRRRAAPSRTMATQPSFETHRCAMLLRMRAFSKTKSEALVVRSVALATRLEP